MATNALATAESRAKPIRHLAVVNPRWAVAPHWDGRNHTDGDGIPGRAHEEGIATTRYPGSMRSAMERPRHRTAARLVLALGWACCWLPGCDRAEETEPSEAQTEAQAADPETVYVQSTITAESVPSRSKAAFDLAAVTELVKTEKVDSPKALEARINDPEARLTVVDIDDDKEPDFIQVVEVRKGQKVVLQFRAIPSSKKKARRKAVSSGVIIAEIVFTPVKTKKTVEVEAHYTSELDHAEEVELVIHYSEPIEYKHDTVVIVDSHPFLHFLFVVEHDIYVGGYFYDVEVDVVHVHHKHKHHKHKHHKHKHHKHKHKHKHGHSVHVSF